MCSKFNLQVVSELDEFNNTLAKFSNFELSDEVKLGLERLNRIISELKEGIIEQLGEELMSRAGYVYLIKTDEGFYKIGKSISPPRRLRELTKKGTEYIIHIIQTDDCHKLENFLHDEYSHKNRGQEIFQLDENDLRDICWVKHVWYESKNPQIKIF